MDAEQWRAEQRALRDALAHSRAASESRSPRSAVTPSVSVIVACWNAAAVVGRCLAALAAQSYERREIIVVDDGSTDGTASIAERAGAAVVRCGANLGVAHARNLGVRNATGEIVAFVDADGFAHPGWLEGIVCEISREESVGAVASMVLYADNPIVINGAGGTVNWQFHSADLLMNESFEHAHAAPEALYAMGCGMAFRRAALERAGPFDEHIVNYHDDVDMGIRMWRAGYRVLVARDAWIEHAVGQSAGETSRRRLLSERHRMRVALKHAPARELARWLRHEASGLLRAPGAERAAGMSALAWNVRHGRSALAARLRLRGGETIPRRLIDPSWGRGFPSGGALRSSPDPGAASAGLDAGDPAAADALVYGWHPAERIDGRTYRWAAQHAALIVKLEQPARRLRINYAHAPVDTGGVEMRIRRIDARRPLEVVWAGELEWRHAVHRTENRVLSLDAGEYEVAFSAASAWTEPPRETRSLGFALASLSLEPAYEIAPGGFEMASPDVEDHLLHGWFDPEHGSAGTFRWGSARAAAVVRLDAPAEALTALLRLPPADTGGVEVLLTRAGTADPLAAMHLSWSEEEWREVRLAAAIGPGDYVVSFQARSAWSNPGGRDPALAPENRALGVALVSLSFDVR